MLSENPNDNLKIVDCSVFTRKILVAEPNHQYLQRNLEREPAHYSYMETISKNLYNSISKPVYSEKCFQ